MFYNLTDNQIKALRWIVHQVKIGNLGETFSSNFGYFSPYNKFLPGVSTTTIDSRKYRMTRQINPDAIEIPPEVNDGTLNALAISNVLLVETKGSSKNYTLTGTAYKIADFDFDNPDPDIQGKYLGETPHLMLGGDFVGNDKVQGDKIGGDKIEGVKNITYNIGQRKGLPNLILSDLSAINFDHRKDGSQEWLLQFRLVCQIENESQYWVEQATMGFVYYAVKVSGEKAIAKSLINKIDLRSSNINARALPYKLQQQKLCSKISFDPYEIKECSVQSLAIYLSPNLYDMVPYEWKAALYIVSKDTAPVWYQISMTISEEILPLIRENSPKIRDAEISKQYLKKERYDQTKPVVGLILLDSNE